MAPTRVRASAPDTIEPASVPASSTAGPHRLGVPSFRGHLPGLPLASRQGFGLAIPFDLFIRLRRQKLAQLSFVDLARGPFDPQSTLQGPKLGLGVGDIPLSSLLRCHYSKPRVDRVNDRIRLHQARGGTLG